MTVNWHGLSCFSLHAKNPDGEVRLVIDPYDNATGLRFPRTLAADIAVSSYNDTSSNNLEAVQAQGDAPVFHIDQPGEYEVKGVFVYAFDAPRKDKAPHQIHRIEMAGMTFVHLGSLDRSLTDAEVDALGNVDVLLVPVGGERVLDAKSAAAAIQQIEPRVVVPMTFALPNVKEKLGTVDAFTKGLGAAREDVSKLKLTRKSLPEEDMALYVLSRD